MKQKRDKLIKIRVTQYELAQLNQRKTHLQLASWMREICLGQPQTAALPPPKADPELLRQLAGVGNNLNQIARQLNSIQLPLDVKQSALFQLLDIEREVKRIHDKHRT